MQKNKWTTLNGTLDDIMPETDYVYYHGVYDDPEDPKYGQEYDFVKTVNIVGYFDDDTYGYGYIDYTPGYPGNGYVFVSFPDNIICMSTIKAWRIMDDSEKYHP